MTNGGRWSSTFKYGFGEACCHAGPDTYAKVLKILNFVGKLWQSGRQTSIFFLSVGKRRTIPKKEKKEKKRHILSFDTKCGNKHNTSQTILKLHRRLADEIQRPENTWRKDKSRNQREADITTMRGLRDRRWWRKGDHLLCFLFFRLLFHFRSSPVCPFINTVQQWFSFPFARFSHVQDVCPFPRRGRMQMTC